MYTVTKNHPSELVILCFHSSGNLTIVLTTYLSRSYVVNYLWQGYLQGISYLNGTFELALRDKDMEVKLGLKMVLEC